MFANLVETDDIMTKQEQDGCGGLQLRNEVSGWSLERWKKAALGVGISFLLSGISLQVKPEQSVSVCG